MSKEKFDSPQEEKEKTDPAFVEESAWVDEKDLDKMDELGRPKKKLLPKRFGEWPKAA